SVPAGGRCGDASSRRVVELESPVRDPQPIFPPDQRRQARVPAVSYFLSPRLVSTCQSLIVQPPPPLAQVFPFTEQAKGSLHNQIRFVSSAGAATSPTETPRPGR